MCGKLILRESVCVCVSQPHDVSVFKPKRYLTYHLGRDCEMECEKTLQDQTSVKGIDNFNAKYVYRSGVTSVY